MRMGIGLGVGINRSNYAQGIFNAYSARVVADGGVVESGTCVDAVSSLLQSASLLLIPSGYKGGKLYAEIPTNGNGDLTWTRGSDAFRTNASGLIQRVPWNLFQYSEQFDNAAWGKEQLSVSSNIAVAPNGTSTADALVENTASAVHRASYFVNNVVAGNVYTISFYLKNNGRRYFYMNARNAFNAGSTFDLQNGVVSTTGVGTASITNVGDGWYRCTITGTCTTSGSYTTYYQLQNSGVATDTTYTGDGVSGFFIWGAQLVEGTTAQTYLPTTDRLNFPRLSYMYGSCPSALLEPQRTNLFTYSAQLDEVNWSKQNCTITANSSTAPDGTLSADLVDDGTAVSTQHWFFQNPTLANSTAYTISFYAKYVSRKNMTVNIYNGSTSRYVVYDIQNGVIVGSTGDVTASITSVGNGWYRIVYTRTMASSGSPNFRIAMADDTGSETYTGSNKQLYLWGFQLEAGAYPTTYIPTTSATASRVADSFSRNNIYTNGLISASGGTWFVELRGNVEYLRSASTTGLSIGDTSTGVLNGICIRNATSSPAIRLTVSKMISGSLSALYTTTTDTTKIAIKWNGTSMDVFVNGTKQVSATAFTTTVMEYLLCDSADVPRFIQQMALFPTPLTDAQCQTLTT